MKAQPEGKALIIPARPHLVQRMFNDNRHRYTEQLCLTTALRP